MVTGFGATCIQAGEIVLALVLSSFIGIERQLRGKSAGLRTQAIVGTTAALMMVVSKYGFMDLIGLDHVSLDPSRVAAQIVSGVSFLGAGIILTRSGAVHGLTTAATVWETAAIGMAAGSGLWELALLVTMLHFLIVYGLTPLSRRIEHRRPHDEVAVTLSYTGGRGVLRHALEMLTRSGWTVSRVVSSEDEGEDGALVSLQLRAAGTPRPEAAVRALGKMPDIHEVHSMDPEDLD